MANEYLTRTPTSTGNRQVFTWSAWVKNNVEGGTFFQQREDVDGSNQFQIQNKTDGNLRYLFNNGGGVEALGDSTALYRDYSSWQNIIIAVDTTTVVEGDRTKVYVDGVKITDYLSDAYDNYPSLNFLTSVNATVRALIGIQRPNTSTTLNSSATAQLTDCFLVDGQALTPDVFGFYKDGNGYISAGSTQSTDFRPGQWVPKSPSVIKNVINDRGGFGVNGFYLPMNDSSNFGADFHCDPNSIITLKGEDLPQPRNGAPTTTDAYVSQLRTDPNAANLVLAVPGISTSTSATLVTNGTFDSGTTGWTINDAAEGSMAVVNGQLVVSNTDTSDPPAYAYQLVTVEVGKRYTVGVDLVGGTASSIAYYLSYSNDSLASFASRPSNSGYGNRYISFTATSTTLYVILRVNANAIATAIFDNVVVKQENAPLDYSADIKGSGTNKTLTAVGSAGVGYELGNYYGSAMTFDGTGDYLTSPANDPDFQPGSDDYTVEAWINPTSLTDGGGIAGVFNYDGVDRRSWLLYHGSSSDLNFIVSGDGTSATQQVVSSPTGILTTNQWAHTVGEKEGNNLTLYLNGVVVGIITNAPTTLYTNTADTFQIGNWNGTSTDEFHGSIQDVRIYKGVAKYKGGFNVPRPYTPVGIESWRATTDTTANNFDTLNPLNPENIVSGGSRVFADGNLNVTTLTSGTNNIRSGMGILKTQKIYFEVRQISATTSTIGFVGILPIGQLDTSAGQGNGVYYYGNTGTRFNYVDNSATITPYGDSYATGDIIGFAFNDNGEVTLYKNNVSQGVIRTFADNEYPLFLSLSDGSSTDTATYSVNFGQNPSFSGTVTAGTFTDDSGKGLFKYQPPTGFLALCEDNLPTPAIADPGEYMRTVLYNGDGKGSHSITGLGFQPDLVWIKERTDTSSHQWFDTVRGVGVQIGSNATTGDRSFLNRLNSFDSDGFTLGNSTAVNSSTDTFVAWCWKAGGAAVSNTDGTITSQVSANQTAGFSIVSYTGTGSAGTIGHGLGKTPSFRISKNRGGTANWYVWHEYLAADEFLILNQTAAITGSSSIWNNTLPTDTTISYTSTSGSFIEYVWAEIEGFSKFGSYVGNGSADGPFVYCGFKPAYLLVKRTDSAADWIVIDSSRSPVNGSNFFLYPNLSSGDAPTSLGFDVLSNGFKLRGSLSNRNASGGTFIFAAFAESPFKTANAK